MDALDYYTDVRMDAYEQGMAMNWIPCSERMPKTNGVYLVTRKIAEDNCVWFITDAVYFDGQNTWHNDNRVNHGRDYLKDVIAWMEKPEPYKIN